MRVERFSLACVAGVGLAVAWLFVPVRTHAQEQQLRSGTIIGQVKSQKDTPDGKNTFIEVLAAGEEKARKYHVLYDAKIKGPVQSVLTAVRATKVGNRVEFEWVQTGHGPAIKSFKVVKKSTDGKKKKDTGSDTT